MYFGPLISYHQLAKIGDIKEITSSFSMKELCPPYKEEYSKIFKKNIKQYSCELTNKFSPKFDPAIFLYHDGLSGYLVQYQIQTGAGFTTFTAACDSYKTCTLMKNWMSLAVFSLRQMSHREYLNLLSMFGSLMVSDQKD